MDDLIFSLNIKLNENIGKLKGTTNFGISVIICELLIIDFSWKHNKKNNKNSLVKIKY